jgi:hypothetical protein
MGCLVCVYIKSQNAVELVALVTKWMGIGCEALQRAAIGVDVEVHGGKTLKASFSGRDLEVMFDWYFVLFHFTNHFVLFCFVSHFISE